MKRITPQETAQILEVSIKTLANWRSESCGPPFYKKGRIIFYDKRDVESFDKQRIKRIET